MADTNTILELRGVIKTFPGVVALDHVDFDVRRGEVIALVGENGAGKSTLIKLLGGVHKPDAGSMVFDGKEVLFQSTQESQESNISVIYQEFNLVPDLTVAENIFMGREPKLIGGILINWKKINADSRAILDRLESDIDPRKYVSDLPVAERQMTEIAKALSFESKLIIMDEPTATLTDKEVRKLFEIVKLLREEGVSIIYISHRMEEAFELSDRITVLRDGKKIGTKETSETNENEIIEMMVGKVVNDYFEERSGKISDEVIMEVKNYSIADHVDDVSFSLRKGEILGLAGVLGSGVHHLLGSLYGAVPKKGGDIYFEGKKVEINSTKDAIRLGIGYVTEDRKRSGLFPDMSVLHNISLIIIRGLTFFKNIFIKEKEEEQRFEEMRKTLSIKTADKDQKIIYLSGGNQQKVLIGRTLLIDCKVLILLEPTRGIDVGSKAEIHRILRELADGGMSIIFTSSELPELVNLPDRCIVLYKGEKTKEFTRETMDSEKLVAAQIGHKGTKEAAS
jgi:ABC-type sugar transport system ATPase subunit